LPKNDFISAEPSISVPFEGKDDIDISSAKRKKLKTVRNKIKFKRKKDLEIRE